MLWKHHYFKRNKHVSLTTFLLNGKKRQMDRERVGIACESSRTGTIVCHKFVNKLIKSYLDRFKLNIGVNVCI